MIPPSGLWGCCDVKATPTRTVSASERRVNGSQQLSAASASRLGGFFGRLRTTMGFGQSDNLRNS